MPLMRFIGLISGGKDGFFSIMKNIKNKHSLVGILYIHPINGVGDSYMYQSVGFEIVQEYAKRVGVPLFIEDSEMLSKNTKLEYEPTIDDEVEDLYMALSKILEKIEFEGVSSGAIASVYQKTRIESVCSRLKVKSLAPLWKANQRVLLKEMIDSGISAIIAKIANTCIPSEMLGSSLGELYDYLKKTDLKSFNECGEGGEYETICVDAPFFKKRIKILDYDVICDTEDPKPSSAYYMKIKRWELEDKSIELDKNNSL